MADKAEELARERQEFDKWRATKGPGYQSAYIREKSYQAWLASAAVRPHLESERWIPVGEKLPEQGRQGWYLVSVTGPSELTGGEITSVLCFCWSGKRWVELRGWGEHEITHWRPLPAPPEEEMTR